VLAYLYVLDARGAVGFTERQALFAEMRDLSRQVAQAYLTQREEMGFPWLSPNQAAQEAVIEPSLPQPHTKTADLLLEIGTEELPTDDLDTALAQLQATVPELLEKNRLSYAGISIQGTPRRLVVLVEDLQTQQADRVVVVKGPPAERAFDATGKPTKAAEGFARSRGVEVSALKVQTVEGGDYVVAEVLEKGQSAAAILAQSLPELYSNIRFTKSMRWNQTGTAFSRPVRWLVAL